MEQRLHDAALKGNVESLRELHREDQLLLHRAAVGYLNETPLHVAALLGHSEFVTEVTNLNPELAESLDSQRSSPLHLASAKGYLEIVRTLILVRPEMCAVVDRNGLNPLHHAAMKGKVEALRELARARPQAARARADYGQTILHLCVKKCQMEALKLLVENLNFDDKELINAKDDYGNTILHLAVADKQATTVKYLLGSDKVDVNATNRNGYTALDILAQSQRDVQDWEIGNCLQEAGGSKTVTQPRKNNLNQQYEWLEKKRDALMVVASLLASMAFQAGVNPPGGVWQEDSAKDSPSPHKAGEAVIAYTYSETYKYYLRANTIGFVASLSTILLLISGLPLKRRKTLMSLLIVIMWLTITSMAYTYLYSIVAITPKQDRKSLRHTMNVAISVWVGVMALLLLGHTIRFTARRLRRKGVDVLHVGPFRRFADHPAAVSHANGNLDGLEVRTVK